MRLPCGRRVVGCVSLALFLLTTLNLHAKNGRDFGGVYSIKNVVEQGDQAVVTMRVQVFNYSNLDLKNAVITLRPLHAGAIPAGAFKPVKLWKKRGEIRATQQVLVSRHELDRWGKGSQPALFVVYHDANGQRWERYVQLTSRPVIPE